jgi:iron complex transport system substrate-binding protein
MLTLLSLLLCDLCVSNGRLRSGAPCEPAVSVRRYNSVMPRIVSLLASATEIVCALGRRAHLVGRSHECDFPASIRSLPICTRPRFRIEGSSAAIDERVKALLAAGEPIYEVDAELMQTLRPDVIVTQSQCVVCAVSDGDVARALIPGLEPKPRVVSLAPNDLDGLWTSIADVAAAIGAEERGTTLVLELRHRMGAIADDVQALTTRPSIACLEWLDPLMAAGNWAPELVEMAGGLNIAGLAGKHSPSLTWDELAERDPDIILGLPCGFDLARTEHEMRGLTPNPQFTSLRAVRNGRVFVADGNQFFNRPGPRLVESLEILAEIIHPERFQFGHEGSAWRRFHL